jgi:hypothetical protein
MAYTYRIFGLTLQSTLPLINQLEAPGAAPDLYFTCTDRPAERAPAPEGSCLYVSDRNTPDGEPLSSLHRVGDGLMLRIAGVADYHVGDHHITAELHDPDRAPWAEIHFLSSGLGLWQELRGVPVLHGSVVHVNGGAVAFLAHSGQGKSALAAALVRAGYPLLADDNLHISFGDEMSAEGRFLANPGYPQMRMWPDEADHFLGGHAGLAPVIPGYDKRRVPVGAGGFGKFCETAQPLTCFYVPERCKDPRQPVEIVALSPAEAVISLIRFMFMQRSVRALGLEAHHLGMFARLAESVPVRKLRYPSGFENLDRTVAAILEDQARLDVG